ncbi:MAG: serine/threonine-protein kinase, partial [Acidobacteriota bacterium]
MSIHEPPPSGRQRVLGRKVGPIRITDWLADGGMGEVYLGWDERLERQVALKAVRRQRLDDRATDEARARLLREARILSRLDDPKICQIHDYIEGDDGDWLVLEWVDGDTLSDIDLDTVSRARRLEIAQHIAEVLVETHAQGIVHRDLKPSNVMLARDGAVKVLDFGVARWSAMEIGSAVPKRGAGLPVVEGEPSRPDIETRFGDLLGTILYMSPEQARGELVTPASDLYAFGLLLGEMLTGEPPYPPDLPATAVLVRVARGERPDARRHADALGPDMVRLIDDLTRVDPAARPTAGETVRRLSWERGRPKRRWRRGRATAAAVAAQGVATGITHGVRATW